MGFNDDSMSPVCDVFPTLVMHFKALYPGVIYPTHIQPGLSSASISDKHRDDFPYPGVYVGNSGHLSTTFISKKRITNKTKLTVCKTVYLPTITYRSQGLLALLIF
jgi:hypothetical protein